MKKRQGNIASVKRGERQAVDHSLHPVVRHLYRVHCANLPMNADGSDYRGEYAKQCGWYWIRHGCALPIKAYGLKNARWIASTLNKANTAVHRRAASDGTRVQKKQQEEL